MFELFQKLFKKNLGRKRQTTPIETTPLFDSYMHENERSFDYLTKDHNGSVVSKKLETTQRFHEFLWRLDQRYQQLKFIEAYIYHSEHEHMVVPMKDVQMEFVNRVEAYYQQLYASLSAFNMFLNHVAPHSFKRGLSIKSITKFLDFLKTKVDFGIQDEIYELERARYFRAKFVDHIQQHTLHNWMTFTYSKDIGPECVIIYYISRGPEVYFRSPSNPYADDFKPPVNYESFYVSPPHDECHSSMFSLCQKVIRNISYPDPHSSSPI